MTKFWISGKIAEISPRLLIRIEDEIDPVVFNHELSLDFNIDDDVRILTDDVIMLSIPPQKRAFKIIKKGSKKMMHFNLIELKDKFTGKFTKTDLDELEAIENCLRFEKFDNEIALQLGNVLHDKAKPRGAVAIRITRESDELPIFQVIMDGKTQRHLDFGEAKRQTVLKTGHCSMWPLVKETVEGGLDHIFKENSCCLCGSGGFPIYVGDELVATVFVSGLHEGQDQLVLIEALSEVLNVNVPEYHGFIF